MLRYFLYLTKNISVNKPDLQTVLYWPDIWDHGFLLVNRILGLGVMYIELATPLLLEATVDSGGTSHH